MPTVSLFISGETIANVEHILQGHQGGKLTDKGISQAKVQK